MENIKIKNANVNNLKNLTLDIMLNKITAITGVSGCGKSSLVYETIYAESQRNFLETMLNNFYGFKFMEKPNVEMIENLRPSLCVSQNNYNKNPNSTLGTITDLSLYIKNLFALIISYKEKKIYDYTFFSLNKMENCCQYCLGVGTIKEISLKKIISDENKLISEGAIKYYEGNSNSYNNKILNQICSEYNININKKFSELSEEEKKILLYRKEENNFVVRFKTNNGKYRVKKVKSKGIMIELEEKKKYINKPSIFKELEKYLDDIICKECNGTKYGYEVLRKKICNKNIFEIENMNLNDLLFWITEIKNKYSKIEIQSKINEILIKIEKKINTLNKLKLMHLNLNRSIASMSSGEIQRIRIANQLSSSINGLIYIFDEPCKGLHYLDINLIIDACRELVNKGNTIIAIEHNNIFLNASDEIVELGPKGGDEGGYLLKKYIPNNVKYNLDINLKKNDKIKDYITFSNININNIKNEKINIPIEKISFITGVSGTGKSSLVKAIYEKFKNPESNYCVIGQNADKIKKIEFVNQNPIGKNARSTVASYLELLEEIREVYSSINEAKEMKLTASHFSLNTNVGTCEKCKGNGNIKIEFPFLQDTYIKCDICNGKRFKDEVLNIKFKGYSINEILNLQVKKLLTLFKENKRIYRKLESLKILGLDYLTLGQQSMTLSGGEAQRIKLVKALYNWDKKSTLYILDEPTSGLNKEDVQKFEIIINKIIENKNTLLIIEHNVEFIARNADYIIDLGVQSGNKGGKIIYQGILKKGIKEKNFSMSTFFNNLTKKNNGMID